jgi:hypothetical protein
LLQLDHLIVVDTFILLSLAFAVFCLDAPEFSGCLML